MYKLTGQVVDLQWLYLEVTGSLMPVIIIRITTRWRNLSFSHGTENFEKVCVMLQNIMEYLNTIKRHLGRIFMKFERDEDSEISFCVCSTRIFNYELLVDDTAYSTVGIVHSLKITSHVKAFSNDEITLILHSQYSIVT